MTKKNKLTNVLVLGFYDRANAGDEMYKTVIPRIFSNMNANFTFVCMDDIKEIPSNIDFVICGGGDIINTYFMKKAESIFQNYTGRIYAFSVGIPYESDLKYLHMFDHVFIRSKTEYDTAVKEIGSQNVTYLPDASFILDKINDNDKIEKIGNIKLGICLAQPAFYKNNKADEIINNLITALISLYNNYPTLEIHLLSFNTSEKLTLSLALIVKVNFLSNVDVPPSQNDEKLFAPFITS